MASISKIGTRWRAHIRKASQTRCKTFGSRALAKSWATTVEREVYPLKSWGGSKSADLKRLKAEFGNDLAAHLTHERLMEAFMQMHGGGAGGVTISARAGYLVGVISTAKDVWRLNVPLEAAQEARNALGRLSAGFPR